MTGIVLIDKPEDWTSHDVVAKLRGLFHERRIGHAGTLDPMATGLLTVFVGRATRAVEFAAGESKTYIAGLQLGITTDTQDTTGKIIARSDSSISQKELEAVLPRFRGEISQIPPMYSAVKVKGQRLYKLARKGQEIERTARRIIIENISVLEQTADGFSLEITCSKGTYIRTLCHDIGQALGCGGAMSALRRTRAGVFSVGEAVTLGEIEGETGDRSLFLKQVDTLFATYPQLTLTAGQERFVRNGRYVPMELEAGIYRVYGEDGSFLALGEVLENTEPALVTIKSFFEPS